MPGARPLRQFWPRQAVTITLAFDCAVTGLSAAVLRDDACLARAASPGRDQPARLLPTISHVLDQAKVGRQDIELIAVTVGPGSFTGVRVGLATARGLALALGVPLAGIATTTVLLAQDPAEVAAIDSRLGDWFCALRGDGQPFLADAPALAARLSGRSASLVGAGAEALAESLRALGIDAVARDQLPDAAALARLALARGVAHWRQSNEREGMPRPLYLRGVNVTSPDGQRRTVE